MESSSSSAPAVKFSQFEAAAGKKLHVVELRIDLDSDAVAEIERANNNKKKKNSDNGDDDDDSATFDTDLVNKAVRLFNRYNKDVVKNYDYSVESETRFEIQLLFKHVMKKMNVSQKYVHYHIELLVDDNSGSGGGGGGSFSGKVVFHKAPTKNANPNFFVVDSAVDFAPIKNVFATYVVDPAARTAVVKFCYAKVEDQCEARHEPVMQSLVEEMVRTCFDNFRRHVSLDPGTRQLRITE